MRSAEEIIKGLECCSSGPCPGSKCPYGCETDCADQVERDALELIRLQEKQINRQSEMILRAYPAPEPHDAANHPEPHDAVNHPGHYTQGGIECIDALKAATTGLEGIEAVCTGNAIKYLWRWKQKNGTEDLRKAEWYINRLIAEQETEP